MGPLPILGEGVIIFEQSLSARYDIGITHPVYLTKLDLAFSRLNSPTPA